MKLALGTVQFGTDYGAFNAEGRVDQAMAAACLDQAQAQGIDLLDTARAYGESEQVLGRLDAASRFRIVTKVPGLGGAGADGVSRSIEASLAALRTDRVHAVLLHDASDLGGPGADLIWRRLDELVEGRVAAKVGVSVYDPGQALALAARYPLGIVQAPYSAFDQRMRTQGAFSRLAESRVEIHVRSIFLQGFALADPAALPVHLRAHRPALERFRVLAERHGLSPLQLALAAAEQEPAIDRIVVGVQSLANLDEILDAAGRDRPILDLAECASDAAALINPSLWQSAA